MKNKTLIAALATALFAGAASAQMTTLLPGGYNNLLIGTPTSLPGAMPSPVISPRIGLPSPQFTPTLTPTLTAALSPVAVTLALPRTALPLTLPTVVPAYRVTTQRVIAAPAALRRRLSAASKDGSAEPTNERLEKLFDGRKNQKPGVGLPDDLSPVRPGRRINLPEQDLEDEIGAY